MTPKEGVLLKELKKDGNKMLLVIVDTNANRDRIPSRPV